MGILVRDLAARDLDAVVELVVQTWQDTYRGLMPDAKLDRMTVENLRPGWKNRIEADAQGLQHLGAFDKDELLGVCSFGEVREDLGYDRELWSMNVPLRSQRRGVGRALLEESLRRMKAAGYRSMYLCCIDTNQKALNFYQAMGGQLSGQSAERDGYRELVLVWKALA